MKRYTLQILLILISSLLGGSIFYYFYREKGIPFVIGGALLGALLGFITIYLEEKIRRIPFLKILGGSLGLILGLFLAKLISSFFEIFTRGVWQVFLYVMSGVGLGYLGIMLGGKKVEEVKIGEFLEKFIEKIAGKIPSPVSPISKKFSKKGFPKVLDTSAIIDGRIVELAKTGWLEGPLILPRIVLEEIQLLSDSTDPIKRSKGRRALELLNELKEIFQGEFRIVDQNYKNLPTDEKLIKICSELSAKLITTDFNLNKLSKLYGVEVLNINELFLALRPAVRPGDLITVQIVKEGKEKEQGVGYLEDGTMVVVENAKHLIGKNLEVVVNHLIHSPTGRIVFAQLRNIKSLNA
ncbi:MAG: PIN/TRAM domain-containing protein [Caldimicrobium sp.]|uniref:PIN domain nuclease n=1 Tax=Caldimicrobium thiodismutans TaxID=1653476 RepID=A0A2N7PIP9_9BACT|nr:MAG: PIN domain nuclease [Caldimicrobium thiodismutans]